jgi:hypothetical protein
MKPYIPGWEKLKRQAAILDRNVPLVIQSGGQLLLTKLVRLLADERFQEYALECLDGFSEGPALRERIAQSGGADEGARKLACMVVTCVWLAGQYDETVGVSKAA